MSARRTNWGKGMNDQWPMTNDQSRSFRGSGCEWQSCSITDGLKSNAAFPLTSILSLRERSVNHKFANRTADLRGLLRSAPFMPQEQGIGDTLAVHSMPLCSVHVPAGSSPRSGERGSGARRKNVGNRQLRERKSALNAVIEIGCNRGSVMRSLELLLHEPCSSRRKAAHYYLDSEGRNLLTSAATVKEVSQ